MIPCGLVPEEKGRPSNILIGHIKVQHAHAKGHFHYSYTMIYVGLLNNSKKQ